MVEGGGGHPVVRRFDPILRGKGLGKPEGPPFVVCGVPEQTGPADPRAGSVARRRAPC